MRAIEDVVQEWVAEFGILARGKSGPYRYIEYTQKKDLLMVLIRTLIEEGHSEEVLKSIKVANLIVNACEAPEGASSRPVSKIRKSKQITASQLKFVLLEFFRGKFSTHTPESQNNALPPSPETEFETPKKEKILEIDPLDRIRMDVSTIPDNDLDLDFLKDLGEINE